MKQLKTVKSLLCAGAFAAIAFSNLSVQAQYQYPLTDWGTIQDVVIWGPGSNLGGTSGSFGLTDSGPSEYVPAFLQANAPGLLNNVGVTFYEYQDYNNTTVSDQLWIQNGWWYFASDPDTVNFQSLGISEVSFFHETGFPYDVSGYFGAEAGSMLVASGIPEPTTFALAGLGAAVVMIFRRRK